MAVATQPQIDVHDNSLDGARAWFAQKGLSRPREGRLLAGVSAGFARRFDIHPLVARLLSILGVVVLSPLVYVAAWVLMPNEAESGSTSATSKIGHAGQEARGPLRPPGPWVCKRARVGGRIQPLPQGEQAAASRPNQQSGVVVEPGCSCHARAALGAEGLAPAASRGTRTHGRRPGRCDLP